jgi:hypothetical protein
VAAPDSLCASEYIKYFKELAKQNSPLHQVIHLLRSCVCPVWLCAFSHNSLRQMVAGVALTMVTLMAYAFYQHSSLMAEYLSEPQLMLRGRGRNGGTIMIDDFREAYWWVRDNTPKDSRIMYVELSAQSCGRASL